MSDSTAPAAAPAKPENGLLSDLKQFVLVIEHRADLIAAGLAHEARAAELAAETDVEALFARIRKAL